MGDPVTALLASPAADPVRADTIRSATTRVCQPCPTCGRDAVLLLGETRARRTDPHPPHPRTAECGHCGSRWAAARYALTTMRTRRPR